LPLLGGHQDNRLVPGPRDSYRAPASLYLIRGGGQALSVVAHDSQAGRSAARLTNTGPSLTTTGGRLDNRSSGPKGPVPS
jgi:excinuclease UvrABC ATPase subunit